MFVCLSRSCEVIPDMAFADYSSCRHTYVFLSFFSKLWTIKSRTRQYSSGFVRHIRGWKIGGSLVRLWHSRQGVRRHRKISEWDCLKEQKMTRWNSWLNTAMSLGRRAYHLSHSYRSTTLSFGLTSAAAHSCPTPSTPTVFLPATNLNA